jgi:hypothetical protein
MRPQSILRFIALIILLVSCGSDETISGYADRKMIYALASIDNAPFTARATIAFAKEGAVNGTRPCNTFQAAQSVPYPWFALGPSQAHAAPTPISDKSPCRHALCRGRRNSPDPLKQSWGRDGVSSRIALDRLKQPTTRGRHWAIP